MLRFHLPLIEPDVRISRTGSPTGFTDQHTKALSHPRS